MCMIYRMRSPKRHLFVNAVRQAINGLKTDFKAQDVGCSLNTTHQAALHSSTIFESKSDATTAVCDHMDDLCHESLFYVILKFIFQFQIPLQPVDHP